MTKGTKETCTCKHCQGACQHKPGWMMPGQAQVMAKHLGISEKELFDRHLVVDYWFKTDGSRGIICVLCPQFEGSVAGGMAKAGILGATGQCHWYVEGRCAVHAVKPYECAQALCCVDNKRSTGLNHHEACAIAWDTPENQQYIFDLLGFVPENPNIKFENDPLAMLDELVGLLDRLGKHA